MDALNAFIREHHPKMVGYAVRKGLSEADAQDCAQSAWLYLHKSGRLSEALPVNFLMTTMHGRMLDHWRRLRLHVKRGMESLDGIEGTIRDERTPDKALAGKELRSALTSLGLADQFESKRAMTLREKTARWRHRESWKQTLMPYAA